jgi:hypothetical protein
MIARAVVLVLSVAAVVAGSLWCGRLIERADNAEQLAVCVDAAREHADRAHSCAVQCERLFEELINDLGVAREH